MQFIQPGAGALMIERPADRRGQLFFKHPQEKLARHCQVVVDASEILVVTSLGSVLGILPPGRHTLDPGTLPFLAQALDPSGSEFQVEAFFVTTVPVAGCQFGGPAGAMRDQQGSMMDVMLFGAYTVRVADAARMITNLLGSGSDAQVALKWANTIVLNEVKGCLAAWVHSGHFGAANIASAVPPLAQTVPQHCGKLNEVGLEVVRIDSITVKVR